MLLVRHRQHCLEPPQDAVGAPVLGELDRRAHQISLVLVELLLEALEQREGVGGAAGEASKDAILVQAPHFLRAAFDDDLAERHLAVAAERDARASPYGKNGGAVELFHEMGKEEETLRSGVAGAIAGPPRALQPASAARANT